MSKRRPIIPFSWWPGSWGLKGKTRAIAQAEYELSGTKLELKLVDIEHADNISARTLAKNAIYLRDNLIDPYQYDLEEIQIKLKTVDGNEEYERAKLELDFKHGKITEYEYDLQKLGPELDDPEWKLKKLEFNVKHGKLLQSEKEKLAADIRGEPWVSIPNISWDPLDSSKTYFELDYNESFVQDLRDRGNYRGTEAEVIDAWLTDVCASIAEEMNQIPSSNNFVTTVQQVKLSDDRTEYR
jgi:hypothetical protein